MNAAAGELRPRDIPTLTLSDTPRVFVVKCLLFPVISLLTLLVCLGVSRERMSGGYFLVAVLTFVGVSEFLGIARISTVGPARRCRYLLLEFGARWVALMAFVAIVLRLCGLTSSLNFRLLVTWAAITPVALFAAQFGARYWLTHMRGGGPKRGVVVGMTEMALRLEQALAADPLLETRIVGCFEDRALERLAAVGSSPILGNTAEIAAFVRLNSIDFVYITLPMKRDKRITAILDSLHDSTASIYFLPDLFAFDLIQARFDILGGIPIVAVRETPFQGASWLLKRVSDVIVSAAALLLLSPVLLLVAACIRLDSHGPVFFKQKRYGLDGREILVYKFRSMKVTEDGKDRFTAATRADDRITRVGHFIRRTSLDELPQFLNVLEGSMSIVGPRPHPVAMNEHYRRAIPSYMVRHKVKPGITGWAQVNGYRGGDDLELMRKRIEYDLEYLRNWSLWLDFQILLKTIAVVWTDRHAY